MKKITAVAALLAMAFAVPAMGAVQEVKFFGDGGWLSDDTRTDAGVNLVGVNYTHAGKPGQTPTAADDTAIKQQIQFVAGPAGSTYGGAVSIDGTAGNNGKSTISVINTSAGFAPASDLVGGTFSATYQWYMQPNSTQRTLAFRVAVQSAQWAASQAGYTAVRSGESAWDLCLVHIMDSPAPNVWHTPTVDLNNGVWFLYGQASNPNWVAIAGSSPPGGTGSPPTTKTLAGWRDDATWGPILFGAGSKVTAVQLGLGSYQRNCLVYVDYLQTTLLNGGDVIDFQERPVNALSLDPTPASIYVKPTETVTVDLNVSNLIQPVTGLQALMNFSSGYFKAGAGEVAVAAGGGDWNELIWSTYNTGGDLDVAVGVKFDIVNPGAGTQADAKTAMMTLTPTGTEGVTKVVFRPNADPDPGLTASTFLSDTSNNPVWPTKIDSVNIYIDGTPPSITCPANVTVSTDAGVCQATGVALGTPTVTDAVSGVATVTNNAPAVYPKGNTTVTWTATDNAGNSATCTQTVTVNDTEAPTILPPANVTVNTDAGACQATGVALGTPSTGDNCGVASVANDAPAAFPKGVTTVTWTVTDTSSNTATCTQTVTVNDAENPVVSIDSAMQGTTELLGTSAVAVQGAVVITVSASDNCPLTSAPAVTVTDSLGGNTSLTAAGSGPWTYTFTVLPTTANGLATITATVTDAVANTATDTDTFTIDKNQATGQVELEGFLGTSRDVTFVATGGTTKTWTLSLSFTGTTASYTLTNVPAGTTDISAKTAWNLRQKLAVTLVDGQATANFTGAEKLLGGDLNGTNSVNILDFSILRTNWYQAMPGAAAADIDGNGAVDLLDYSILKAHWFANGDPQ